MGDRSEPTYIRSLSSEQMREIMQEAIRAVVSSPEYLDREAQRAEERRALEPYIDRTLDKLVITS